MLFVGCSPSGVDSFMCETCFCFLCLSPLSTRVLQLSGFYNCSWINYTAIVHLLVPFSFFCWRFITTCILEHHGGCKQSIFHTAHLWPEMSYVRFTYDKYHVNMCSGARDWSQDSDFVWIFMNRPSLSFNKNFIICEAHPHSVRTTIRRKL